LTRITTSAREAWPSVVVAPEVFVPYLAERLPQDATSIEALEAVRATDLWLACACAQGDEAAVATFTKTYLDPIFPLPGDLARLSNDVRQAASMKLLVSENGAPPRIVEYAGRGDLGSWVSVVALRIALTFVRKKAREVAIDDRVLFDVADRGDAELEHLKRHYRLEFAEAFQHALGALRPRERNVLRQYHVDGLTMDQIARVYRVHRITVVRWIERARDELASETRKILVARLGIERAELDSIMRLIRSQVDISLRRYLGARSNRGA
jgi:RNA polymerase sigma-70 factor (ECF subfamily)